VFTLVGVVMLLAACGGESAPSAVSTTPNTAPPSDVTAPSATTPSASAAPAGTAPAALPEVCALVPKAEIDRATGITFGEPAPTAGSGRSVCAFSAAGGAPGLSVGVEPAARFDAKAAASRNSLGVPGTEVPGLGEQALFFYSDRNFPEGLGGLLLRANGATVDITLQGSGTEQQTRDTAIAIAGVAIERL
jgi:hypothetical protein